VVDASPNHSILLDFTELMTTYPVRLQVMKHTAEYLLPRNCYVVRPHKKWTPQG